MDEKVTKQTAGSETFLYCDGVKVAKLLPNGNIAFHDKNNARCRQRGSDQVVVTAAEFIQAISQPAPSPNAQAGVDQPKQI